MTDKLKFRRRERLSAEAAHELKVIDNALTGLHSETPDDAALTDLAMHLRSARPTADAEAYGRLDARFAERIERDRAYRAARGDDRVSLFDRVTARVLRPAPLAGALAALMIGVTAVSLVGDDSVVVPLERGRPPASSVDVGGNQALTQPSLPAKASPGIEDQMMRSADPAAVNTTAGDAGNALAESAPSSGAARKVESTGDLVLAARSDRVEGVADDVIAITDRFGGYVKSSSVTGGDAANAGANFSLQFPAINYQRALAELSKLAHVRSRTQATQDITDPYSRARNRLAAARTERDRLRAKLAATMSDAEAKALRARVRVADRRVNARENDFKQMRNRVNFVALSLSIVADASAAADDRGTIARAADTARDVLVYFAAVGLVALAIGLPLAMLTAVTVFTTRRVRRGRGDAAIGAAAAGADDSPE